MSPLLLAVLVVITVGALGFALVPGLAGSDRAGKRKKALQQSIRIDPVTRDLGRSRETRRRTVQNALKAQSEALNAKKRKQTLRARLFQAGMKIELAAWIRNCVIVGVVIGIVCILVQVPWYFAIVFGAAGGYVVPNMYLGHRRKRLQSAFLDEFPNAVEAIVRGVRSGLPLNDSMRLVAKEVKEPVKSEFQRVLDQQAVGRSMTEAVEVLFDRIPLPEVNFFIVVITVQQQAGGNLSEALGNLARVLRDRKKLKGKIKAMSAEAKASAWIIGSLPFAVAGLVSVVSPTYLVPLVTTPMGLICLAGAALMLMAGLFVMYRMIQFEY